ncbi:MAG: autotransporter outer membrane beta-barrel domain-containing protein [Achromobacter sp.]|uniref:autotransporter outer membrane beta-barrel domain-containing protein n=1 Tax=Achromobacter sp. TaxID=134375 RepID=UPI003D03B64E
MIQGKPRLAAHGAACAAAASLTPSQTHFAPVAASGAAPAPTAARFLAAAGGAAIALALTGAAMPAWAACSIGDPSGCGAPGGGGFPDRSGAGGAGNGQGGGSSHIDTNGVTVQDPGGWGVAGTGGTGASGDAGSAPANPPALVITSSNITINAGLTGAAGASGPDGNNFGSGGNGGNTGVYYSGGELWISDTVTVAGGAGGNGGSTSNGISGNGGGGGGGGSGVTAVASQVRVSNAGTIIGGVGGAGGAGGFSGGGGAGGDGLLVLGGNADILNIGSITGGAGGVAGAGASGSASAGAGGSGVNLAGTRNTLANAGTITGGAGVGGGVGVVTRGMDTITNQGTIVGALTGPGGARAAAIQFGGASNALNLLTGSSIVGNLLFDAGATATIAALHTGLTLNNDVILTDAASGVTFSTMTTGMTMSGVVSGAGSLTVVGTNTLTLSGANTFTGTTTVSGGTLALVGGGSLAASSGVVVNSVLDVSAVTSGASIQALSGTGTVRLGARSLALTNASGVFDGVIEGSGAVRVGAGAQTLTGINTYSGATLIDSGATLALSGGGSLAASSGVTSNGTLDISATTNGASVAGLAGGGRVALGGRTLTLTNAAGVFSGVIDGTGGLVLNSGTQTLAGVSTYTGATTINGGTLVLSGAGRLSAASAISLMGSGATLDLSAASGQTLAGVYGVPGSRVLAGASTLTLNAATDSVYGGEFTGSGALVKQGAGMLVLNGSSGGFTGTTTVGQGTLQVGDAGHGGAVLGGNVGVGAQGTLGGHGTILGNVTNGGTVSPGGSIGTLSVGGNYTQASNATLAIEVSPTEASLLKVGGSATLNGTLAITYTPGTYSAKRYNVVSAANGISGRFSSVTGSLASGADLNGLRSSVAYGANDVALLLSDPASGIPGDTPVVIAPTRTSIYTALGSAALMSAQSATAAVLERATRRAVGSAQDAADAPDTVSVWANATGRHGRLSGSGGQPGFQENQYGFLAGVDKRIERNTFGLAMGYSHADLSEEHTGSSGTRDTVRLATYASRDLGPVDVTGVIGYGLHFLSQKRPFENVGTAKGDHIGQEFTAAAQVSKPLALGGLVMTPRLGLRYAYFHANSFDEGGARGQNLHVGSDSARSLQPYVGMTFDKSFDGAQRPVNLQFRVAYARELLDTDRAVTVVSQDGTRFAAPGANLSRGFLTFGASVGLPLTRQLDVSLAYDALVNTSRASSQAGTVRMSYRF